MPVAKRKAEGLAMKPLKKQDGAQHHNPLKKKNVSAKPMQ
jgi:hypothetical protein